MKTTFTIIFFLAVFFSFFVLFAQTSNAISDQCTPPYSGYTGYFSTFSACVSVSNYCLFDGSGYFGFMSSKVGTSCVSSPNACGLTNGTCDGYGNCNPPATPYTVGAACNRNVCGGTGTITDACTGTCSASAPTVYPVGTACTSAANACGQTSIGTITDSCTGACSASTPATPYTLGVSCTSAANACGTTSSGTITNACTGACSASTPALPANYGQSCQATNACGQSNTGTIGCTGACSATTPALPSGYGNACISSPNACGQTNSGTIQCNGTCSASTPANPTNYGNTCSSPANNLGQTNSGTIQCNGTCSALTPANATLSFSANPSGNQTNGTNVSYTASSTVAMWGTPYYLRIYEGATQRCSEPSGSTCAYSTSGSNTTKTFTAKIENNSGTQAVTPQNLSTTWIVPTSSPATSTQQTTSFVTAPALTYPTSYWQRLWYVDPLTNNFSDASYLGAGPGSNDKNGNPPDVTSTAFTTDWAGGQLYDTTYVDPAFASATNNGKDHIGFKSSRTVNIPVKGQMIFSAGSDDGIRVLMKRASDPAFTNILDGHWHDHSFPGSNHEDMVSLLSPANGDYQFEIDYYEDTKDAKVEFAYWVKHGIGLALDKSQYAFGENIGLTAKYSGLDQRYQYAVYFTLDNDANKAERGGATHCDISAGALGDPRNNTIGTCGPRTLNALPAIGNHQMCALLHVNNGVNSADVNSDCVDFTVVGCTQNSQCTADPNKAICNLGVTPNFPQNTCIDSVPPTSKITKVEDEFIPGNPPGFAPNIPTTGAYSAFLKADNNGDTKKTWWVLVEDTDNTGGSGIDSCYISINGLTLPRVCNNWASFTVGKPATGAYCATQGAGQCIVKVWATDKVGNTNVSTERKIGYITDDPLSTIEKDQRKYNDSTTYPLGFNVFLFGVDYTAPTAQ